MDAELIHRDRFLFDDGAIVEMVIWRVPKPVPGNAHHYKYRLFYGYPGRRIVGYGNERLKGDHRHLGDIEEPYQLAASKISSMTSCRTYLRSARHENR